MTGFLSRRGREPLAWSMTWSDGGKEPSHRKGDLSATAASNVTGPARAGGRTTEVEKHGSSTHLSWRGPTLPRSPLPLPGAPPEAVAQILSVVTAGLVLAAIAHGVAVVLVMVEHRSSRPQGPRGALLCLGGGGLGAWAVSGDGTATDAAAVLVAGAMILGLANMRRFLVSGTLL
jgi:hypothetical protein